jgi:hypothetical protein
VPGQHDLGDILAIPVAGHGLACLRVLTQLSTGPGPTSASASGAAGVAVDGALGWWAAVCVHRAGKPIRICVGLGLSIMVLLHVVFIRMRVVVDPRP